MKTTTNTGATMVDASEGLSIGVVPQADGTFLALTLTASKSFKSAKGAAAWLTKRGYSPTGARLPR